MVAESAERSGGGFLARLLLPLLTSQWAELALGAGRAVDHGLSRLLVGRQVQTPAGFAGGLDTTALHAYERRWIVSDWVPHGSGPSLLRRYSRAPATRRYGATSPSMTACCHAPIASAEAKQVASGAGPSAPTTGDSQPLVVQDDDLASLLRTDVLLKGAEGAERRHLVDRRCRRDRRHCHPCRLVVVGAVSAPWNQAEG